MRVRLPKFRVKRSYVRLVNMSLPIVGIAAFTIIHAKVYGAPPNFLDPIDTLYLSFTIAVSLIPLAVFEYKWEWELIMSEYEVPKFLSALEGSLRAGLPMPKAIHEASKYVKNLRGKLDLIVKATYLGETLEDSIRHLRGGGSPLIELLADYLVILSRSGEEIYRTVREFRETVEIIVSYSRRLRDATRSFIATLYLVVFVYLVSTIIFLAAFIYPLSEQVTAGIPIIGRVNPELMTSLIIYGATIEAITNGVVVSYFTGSRYLASLIHAIALLFISIISYTVLVFMRTVIPIPHIH